MLGFDDKVGLVFAVLGSSGWVFEDAEDCSLDVLGFDGLAGCAFGALGFDGGAGWALAG